MSKAVKKAPKKKNGYVMPDPIPNGEILTDMAKKRWILGPSIGVGGFGEIYSAGPYNDKKPTDYPYVVKIEPHGNGPLFVEMHFYMRNAKNDDIEAWRSKKKLPTLGMPSYIGSGSHECNGTKYRFVVMEKFGKDLSKLLSENNNQFPSHTAFRIAVQILDVLEYIHSRGYVHADIKGANILMGLGKNNQNQVYLVDFGLAAHFSTKDFKPDPKKAHNGTIEYTSRDAHHGVPTRRGDLEILAYNLIHWLGANLPWVNLKDVVPVQNAKEKYMDNLEKSLKESFKNTEVPDAVKKFFAYIYTMKHDTEPDYPKLRSILVSGVDKTGSMSGPLEFSKKSRSPKRKSTAEEATPTNKRTKKTTEEKQPKSRVRAKPKKSDKSESDENEPVENNGFTAEMMRIKQRMEENKKTGKNKKKVEKISDEEIILSDTVNVIDETPPERIWPKRTRNKINYEETPPSRKGKNKMED